MINNTKGLRGVAQGMIARAQKLSASDPHRRHVQQMNLKGGAQLMLVTIRECADLQLLITRTLAETESEPQRVKFHKECNVFWASFDVPLKYQNEATWRNIHERAGYLVAWEPLKNGGRT